MDDNARYLDKHEAAAYLGVKPWSLDYLVRTGQLGFFKIAGKRRFTKEDLDKYAARNRVAALVEQPAT